MSTDTKHYLKLENMVLPSQRQNKPRTHTVRRKIPEKLVQDKHSLNETMEITSHQIVLNMKPDNSYNNNS